MYYIVYYIVDFDLFNRKRHTHTPTSRHNRHCAGKQTCTFYSSFHHTLSQNCSGTPRHPVTPCYTSYQKHSGMALCQISSGITYDTWTHKCTGMICHTLSQKCYDLFYPIYMPICEWKEPSPSPAHKPGQAMP